MTVSKDARSFPWLELIGSDSPDARTALRVGDQIEVNTRNGSIQILRGASILRLMIHRVEGQEDRSHVPPVPTRMSSKEGVHVIDAYYLVCFMAAIAQLGCRLVSCGEGIETYELIQSLHRD